MDYVTLGRTGLQVSVMGVGGGGPSRLGQREGKPEAESVEIIHLALDAGVNFIDTAEAYGTEEIVGLAIKGRDRSKLIISTKKSLGPALTPPQLRAGLEASLRRLGTDYVDIYNLHGVRPEQYETIDPEIVPTLQRLRDEGKIRFLGITEHFGSDTRHEMLRRALQDGTWEVMMVGFNLLNQTARKQLFPETIQQEVGIQVMFAVRRALGNSEGLKPVIEALIAAGQIDPTEIDRDDPLGFLIRDGIAVSLPDAAYRFCRDEPGTHVILSGTGNPDHLRANLESLTRPPLPADVTARLKHIFRRVDSISG